jgi:hypothetical protein
MGGLSHGERMSRQAVSGWGYQAGGLGGGDCPLPGELTGYEQSECRHECDHTQSWFHGGAAN